MFRSPVLRALAVSACLVGALAACGSDGTKVTSGKVTLESAGAETGRVTLPGASQVGTQGQASAQVSADVHVSGKAVKVGVRLDYDGKVVAADDKGYTVEETFTDAKVLDAPDGTESSKVTDIVGVSIRQQFVDGETTKTELINDSSLSAAQKAAYGQFGSQLDSAKFDYPSEPVAIGARWTSTTGISSQGFDVDVAYHYELTALDGDQYTITVDYDQPIDDTVKGADVTGTISGSGTVKGRRGQPLTVAADVRQKLDVSVRDGSNSTSLTMDMTVAVTPK